MLQLPVAVYGNGDLYRELFNAIATAFSDSTYGSLIRLAILLTGTWAIVRFSVERSLTPMLRWLALYYLVFFILVQPKATVEVIDRINPGAVYTIDNLPLGLAVMANLTSSLGDGLTQLTEKTFSLPDDLHYQKTGMVMASRLALASIQFQITDPNFAQSLQGFVSQCVFYDLLLSKYSWGELLNTPNIWQLVSEKASPARAFLYHGHKGSEIITCQAGVPILKQDWNLAIQDAAAHYGALLFPNSQNAKAQLLAYLPTSYQFLSHISVSGTEILTQNIMQNALQNGVVQMGAETNSPAALEAYSFSKAQMQKRLTNETVGDMAAYWVPLMKNVLEAMLYGSFIFVVLLILFPFGPSVLKNYIGSLMWLQLWAPLYAILNLFMNFYAQHATSGVTRGLENITLLTQSGFAQVNADVASLAGYLSLSVPLLSAGLVKGLMSVFGQAAQYIAGVTQGAASSAAVEAVAGNMSLGNFSYSNHSNFNTSANHFDTNGRVFSGMFTTQMEGGSTLSVTPGGGAVMSNSPAISSLGTSVNLAESMRESYTQHAEKAETAGLNQSHAYSDAMSSAMRSVFELGGHQALVKTDGKSWSLSTTGQVSESIQEISRLTERFAKSHNISFEDASNVLSAMSGSASAGFNLSGTPLGKLGISAGFSGGMRHDSSHNDSQRFGKIYSDATDYIHDTNFAHHLDVVGRAAKDHSLRSSNDEGQRLIDNLGSSWDQAKSARHEMQSSLQEAESYREGANLSRDNAVSINSNASQVVFEALEKQGFSSAEIESLMIHDPAKAQKIVESAVHNYSESIVTNWSHHLAHSVDAIKNISQQYQHQILDAGVVKTDDRRNHQVVAARAKSVGLNRADLVNESLATQVEKQLQLQDIQVHSKTFETERKGEALKEQVHAEESKKQESILYNMLHCIDIDKT